MSMTYTGLMPLIKKLKKIKENMIENCAGKIEKDIKIIIFWMSLFGHSEIKYLWDSNDEVGPPLS